MYLLFVFSAFVFCAGIFVIQPVMLSFNLNIQSLGTPAYLSWYTATNQVYKPIATVYYVVLDMFFALVGFMVLYRLFQEKKAKKSNQFEKSKGLVQIFKSLAFNTSTIVHDEHTTKHDLQLEFAERGMLSFLVLWFGTGVLTIALLISTWATIPSSNAQILDYFTITYVLQMLMLTCMLLEQYCSIRFLIELKIVLAKFTRKDGTENHKESTKEPPLPKYLVGMPSTTDSQSFSLHPLVNVQQNIQSADSSIPPGSSWPS